MAVLAQKIERSESYVQRMFYPPEKAGSKPVGDKMMRLIEAAFDLPRAWLDLPLRAAMPGTAPVEVNGFVRLLISEPSPDTPPLPRLIWPFKLVAYSRITGLQKTLGPRLAQEALNDIDKFLDLAVMKWEREAVAVKS